MRWDVHNCQIDHNIVVVDVYCSIIVVAVVGVVGAAVACHYQTD